MDEKETVEHLMKLKGEIGDLEDRAKALRREYSELEFKLVEYMEERDMKKTAHFDGVGHATLEKPRLYASVTEEAKGEVFKWLHDIGRDDIIKETIHPSTLSSFVREMQEEGKEVNDKIQVFMKSKILLKR